VKVTRDRYQQPIRLVAFPISSIPQQRPAIYIYNDAGFPSAGVAGTAVQGVFDHLSGELAVHGYAAPVSAVSARQLVDVFKAANAASRSIVVMMTGVFPSSVFSARVDLVSPWVEAGGILVWAGGAIGYWSADTARTLSPSNILGEAGTARLLGTGIVKYPTVFGRIGDVPTSLASALDLSYRFTGVGVQRDPVIARGGRTLGWYSGQFSSISYMPRGRGGFLVFGGEVPDESSISVDLARILLARAIYAAGSVATKEVNLSQLPSAAVLDWTLPFVSGRMRIMFLAFDPSPDSVYFSAQVVG
jgi:hypothetical protein